MAILIILFSFGHIFQSFGENYSLNSSITNWNQNYKLNRPNTTLRNFISDSQYKEISPYLSSSMHAPLSSRNIIKRSSQSKSRSAIGINSNGLYVSNNTTNSRSSRTIKSRNNSNSTFSNKRTSNRKQVSRSAKTSQNTTTTDIIPTLSSSECYEAYKECMDNYCALNTTSYKRCFCSEKLATIEATHLPNIENLLTHIIELKNGITISDIDNNDILTNSVSSSISYLENTLNGINLNDRTNADGLETYETAKSYCSQKLSNCYFNSNSLLQSYKIEIDKDCISYTNYFTNIEKNAQKIINSYSN